MLYQIRNTLASGHDVHSDRLVTMLCFLLSAGSSLCPSPSTGAMSVKVTLKKQTLNICTHTFRCGDNLNNTVKQGHTHNL